jgi:hypothetical protein
MGAMISVPAFDCPSRCTQTSVLPRADSPLSKDVVLCRLARALERRIKAAPAGQVQATVKYWEGAWEVEEYFMSLIS